MTKEEKFKLLELIGNYTNITYELGKRAGRADSDFDKALELNNKQHKLWLEIKRILDEQA